MAWRCATEKVATPRRPARRLASMPNNGFGNDPRLPWIRASVTAIVMSVGIVVKLQSHSGNRVIGARYDEEAVVVELLVGYRDKGLMLAAVMPIQHPMRTPPWQDRGPGCFPHPSPGR